MAALEIPTGEQGVTRVFSLSMSPAEAKALAEEHVLQEAALGAEDLNDLGLEVFAISDLGELGLAGYLRDGVDALEADLKRDAAKLGALDGWVLLLHSSAFAGRGGQIEPIKALTLIGTYTQTSADNSVSKLETEAAAPYSGAAQAAESQPVTGQRGGSIVVALLALIVMAVLVWALTR